MEKMTASNSECRWIMKYYIALLAHSIGTNPRLMYKYAALPVFPHLPRPPPPQPNIFPLSHGAAMRKRMSWQIARLSFSQWFSDAYKCADLTGERAFMSWTP